MNSQAFQSYPQTAQKIDVNEPQPERQIFAHIISAISCIFGVITAFNNIRLCIAHGVKIQFVLFILLGISLASFHLLAMIKPDYLKGKPSLLKLAPLFVFSLAYGALSRYVKITVNGIKKESPIYISVIIVILFVLASYFMYGSDDDSGSCCLCFKPWIHKRPAILATYYPQQGYPAQGYPPQGYPPQGYPQQGYPQQQQQQHK